MSIVLEVRCLDFVEGVVSCQRSLGILAMIILVAGDESITQTSGVTEKRIDLLI